MPNFRSDYFRYIGLAHLLSDLSFSASCFNDARRIVLLILVSLGKTIEFFYIELESHNLAELTYFSCFLCRFKKNVILITFDKVLYSFPLWISCISLFITLLTLAWISFWCWINLMGNRHSCLNNSKQIETNFTLKLKPVCELY